MKTVIVNLNETKSSNTLFVVFLRLVNLLRNFEEITENTFTKLCLNNLYAFLLWLLFMLFLLELDFFVSLNILSSV